MASRFALDALAWWFAITLASFLRVDFDAGLLTVWGQLLILPVAALFQLISGLAFGLYTGRFRYGSFEEAASLAKSAGLTTVLLFVADLPGDPRLVPLSATVGGGFASIVLMSGGRYAFRVIDEGRNRPSGENLRRVIVFGAGEGGARIITEMMRSQASPYLPVALLDDDRSKQRLRISGVPVLGTREDVDRVASRVAADDLLIALPGAGRELISDLTERAVAAGLETKVLPSLAELLGVGLEVADIRPVSPADLMGRREIDTDLSSVAEYIEGRKVLVTGAGGSIGSELCRQLRRFDPAQLVMLDRDESALHALELSLSGRGLLSDPELVLADLRDRQTMAGILATVRPDVVFHAAALKHLPVLERHPAEAIKTNVWGTLDLLELSLENGVERFVNISTDKAADPISVLGCSKRVAERLTAYISEQSDGVFLSVRFGNVLGSRGSMLDTFTRQIESGGPVTVTDPNVARFFMTISEAVQLVIQAGAIGGPGEVMVLDMGPPVRIADVAKLLISQSGHEVAIQFTGLRPGEKMQEVLFGSGEVARPTAHPLISHVPVSPLTPTHVRSISLDGDPDVLVARLTALSAGDEVGEPVL